MFNVPVAKFLKREYEISSVWKNYESKNDEREDSPLTQAKKRNGASFLWMS